MELSRGVGTHGREGIRRSSGMGKVYASDARIAYSAV